MPFASFGTHYWFPQSREDREGISQAFECRHGECTSKFKNLKNLRGHMKKKHKLFIEKAELGRPRKNHRVRNQDHKKMNSKIMGDVEKRLRKIHSRQVEVWRQKALASWSKIEENAQNREPIPKPLLCSFIDSKKVEILGISEWGVGLINSKNLNSLETNEVFRRKLATTKASKYATLVTAFSNNQIPHECKMFKEELLAYHEDQEVYYWYVYFELYEFNLFSFNMFLCYCIYVYLLLNSSLTFKYLFVCLRYNLGWEKYEQDMLNVEETLWNMKSTSIRARVEEKVEDYRTRYPHYFRE